MKVTKCDYENEVTFSKVTNGADGPKPAIFGDKKYMSGVAMN